MLYQSIFNFSGHGCLKWEWHGPPDKSLLSGYKVLAKQTMVFYLVDSVIHFLNNPG